MLPFESTPAPGAAEHAVPEGIMKLVPAIPDLFWSAICLAIIALVLWRVMPKITKILDERSQLIEGRIEEAAKLEESSKALLERQNAELAAARTEANEIREQARSEGTQILAELKAHAQEEADRIVENATRQIEAERQTVVVSLREDIGRLASTLAEKIVGESLTDSARQSRLIDSFLTALETSEANGSTESNSVKR